MALAALGAVPSDAVSRAHPTNSLVAGEWPSDMPVSPCDPSAYCINVLNKARLIGARALSGPAVPSELTVDFHMHATPYPGLRVVTVVRRDKDGSWHALWLNQVKPTERECYSPDLYKELGVPVPPGVTKQGDELCFVP